MDITIVRSNLTGFFYQILTLKCTVYSNLTSSSVNLSLFTLLFKGHFTHVHDGGRAFVHAGFLLVGEAKNVKSFLLIWQEMASVNTQNTCSLYVKVHVTDLKQKNFHKNDNF